MTPCADQTAVSALTYAVRPPAERRGQRSCRSSDDNVILLRHFRHATRSDHLEIPRGFGEPGATAEQQAYRELSEETGSAADELISLGGIYPNTGSSADLVELFFARVHQIGEPQTAEGIADLELIKAADLAQMIAGERITDAFTIAAWARASLRGLLPN